MQEVVSVALCLSGESLSSGSRKTRRLTRFCFRMPQGLTESSISLTHFLSSSLCCSCFNVCVMIPSGHMTSMTPVHPGDGSSSVALLKGSDLFSPEGLLGSPM